MKRTHVREIKQKYIIDWKSKNKTQILDHKAQDRVFEFWNGSILEYGYCERSEDAEGLFSAEYDFIFVKQES